MNVESALAGLLLPFLLRLSREPKLRPIGVGHADVEQFADLLRFEAAHGQLHAIARRLSQTVEHFDQVLFEPLLPELS